MLWRVLGFESGNQFVVDKIVNKHLDLEYSRKVVHHLKEIGMTVHGTFTFGLPGETKEQMVDTIRFRNSLGLDTFQQSGAAEIEGTPLATLTEKGHLDAYEAAHTGIDYERNPDGGDKMRNIAHMLRNS